MSARNLRGEKRGNFNGFYNVLCCMRWHFQYFERAGNAHPCTYKLLMSDDVEPFYDATAKNDEENFTSAN